MPAPRGTVRPFLDRILPGGKSDPLSGGESLLVDDTPPLVRGRRYMQVAINSADDLAVLPLLPRLPRVFVEAGEPLLLRYGLGITEEIRKAWPGVIVADPKISDAAEEKVVLAAAYPVSGLTAMGSADIATLRAFIDACRRYNLYSVVDMMGVEDPLRRLWKLPEKPDVVMLHVSQEISGTVPARKLATDIRRIAGRTTSLVMVGGSLGARDLEGAFFNGADMVMASVASAGRKGLTAADFVRELGVRQYG